MKYIAMNLWVTCGLIGWAVVMSRFPIGVRPIDLIVLPLAMALGPIALLISVTP